MIEAEKNIDKKLKSALEEIGGWSIKLLTSHLTGLPDRLCLLSDGRLFFAEIKTTGKKPKKIQEVMHRKLIALGFKVHVIDSTKKIYEILSNYERG
jgi:hypothetical protein